MGEMAARGMGKNKKDAKMKAAEAMVIKLDELPKMNMKRHFGGGYGPGWRGGQCCNKVLRKFWESTL